MKKSIFILMAIVLTTSLFLFLGSAEKINNFPESTERINKNLEPWQEKALLSCNFPVEEIAKLDQETANKILSSENYLALKALEESISKKTGLTLWQIDALVDSGYRYDEIAQMDVETANQILTGNLTDDEKAHYYKALEKELGRKFDF